MTIIEALKQLRIDIQTWVTVNLKALSKKITDHNSSNEAHRDIRDTVDNKLDKNLGEANKILTTDGEGNIITADKVEVEEYELPTASATELGGIKVGAGLSITDGVLSANGGGTADAVEWDNVQSKPEKFEPVDHSHTLDQVSETTDKKIMTASERTKLANLATVATTGKYSDLEEAPSIKEDEPGKAVYADEDGNIVMQVGELNDGSVGIATTKVILNDTIDVETELANKIQVVYSADELSALLLPDNYKKSYLYMGESNQTYESGCIYQVEAPVIAATEAEMTAILSSATDSDIGKLVKFTGTGSTLYETNAIYTIENSEE